MRYALIVDDDISCREIFGHYMGKMGYKSVYAHDGQSALDTLRTAKVDIILLDLEMKGMNGLELIVALKNGPQWLVPIIVLSGNTLMLEEAIHMVPAALTKPIRYAALEPVVRRLMGP